MSAASSACSWAGAAPRGPDIIDLDRYMRGAVRPPRPAADTSNSTDDTAGGELVVDGGKAGGAGLVVDAGKPAGASDRDKRYSHDSGLSEDSFPRVRRSHRRVAGAAEGGRVTRRRDALASRSTDSIRAFRNACERALKEQQAQITRVAELCERLAETRAEPRKQRARPRPDRDSSDTSASSTTTSSRERLKDKRRTESCKTYKIIMSKLDELNRVFATRRSAPSPAPAPAGDATPHCRASADLARRKKEENISTRLVDCSVGKSNSASASDKIKPQHAERSTQHTKKKAGTHRPSPDRLGIQQSDKNSGQPEREARPGREWPEVQSERLPTSDRTTRSQHQRAPPPPPAPDRTTPSERSTRRSDKARRLAALTQVAYAHVLDIAPQTPHTNIATESVVVWSSEGSARDPLHVYDLRDPVHLYAQAKRLQASHLAQQSARGAASGRRVRSAERSPRTLGSARSARGGSLCSLVRNYLRSLKQLLSCCPQY